MDEKKRKQENDRIIARMKRGESLATVPSEATWFPPRPLTVKNENDIKRLYGIKKSQPLCLVQESTQDD